jgi:hypothetical protein
MSSAAAFAQDAVMGNTIHINDKSLNDWRGSPPEKDNASIYSEGEFIWRDALDDDKGNGSYQYPQEPIFEKCADLREFRVTYDKDNLYLLIKAEKPKDWWVPFRVIGITTHLPMDGVSPVYTQGNKDDISSYKGMFGEIKVSKELAPHFVIGISGTYKGRVWDKAGTLIAKADGPDTGNDTPGFYLASVDWAATQIAIPWKILGVEPPEGQTWKFVVGTGCQDYDHLREVDIEPSQWHGGGGEGRFNEDGPDPDLYDLAGAPLDKQQEDLSGFGGGNSDPSQYSEIKNSFMEVKFGKLK